MLVSRRKIAGALGIASGLLAVTSTFMPWLGEFQACNFSLGYGHNLYNLFQIQGEELHHIWPYRSVDLMILIGVGLAGIALVVSGTSTLLRHRRRAATSVAAWSMAVGGMMLLGCVLLVRYPLLAYTTTSRRDCVFLFSHELGYWLGMVAGAGGIVGAILLFADQQPRVPKSTPESVNASV